MEKSELLEAMRADSIPAGWSDLWYIVKSRISEPTPSVRHGERVEVPPGTYIFLYRLTDATLYNDPPGEVVMEDTPFELMTHLGFVMQAHGNVLTTGLGLGCVIRGLLKNPNVEHVTCIEDSDDVLKLVAGYMPKDRLTIIEADALEWTAKNKDPFDCAWHDVWTDRCNGEPHLDFWHAELIMNCRQTVKHQGAWAFDRQVKKRLIEYGICWMG